MTEQQMTVEQEYSPALAVEIAFAVQRLQDAESAYITSKSIKNENDYFTATMALARPEWYLALLKRIDILEGQLERREAEAI